MQFFKSKLSSSKKSTTTPTTTHVKLKDGNNLQEISAINLVLIQTALEQRLVNENLLQANHEVEESHENCWSCKVATGNKRNLRSTTCGVCGGDASYSCCLPQRLVSLSSGIPKLGPSTSLCLGCQQSATKYCIISHVWGKASNSIKIEGAWWDLPISNESKVLSAAKYAKQQGFRWMWMDICCLPQSSSAQIIRENELSFMMSQYYQKAEKQFVILEDFQGSVDSIQKIVSLVNQASEQKKPHMVKKEEEEFPTLETFSISLDPQGVGQQVAWNHFEEMKTLANDFIKFVQSEWWQRVWTLQELFLPTDMEFTMLDGDSIKTLGNAHEIRLAFWAVLTTMVYEKREQEPTFLKLKTVRDRLEKTRSITRTKTWVPMNFAYALYLCADRKCSVVEDKVYGLLGLLSLPPTRTKAFSYNVGLQLACYEVMKACASNGDRSAVIGFPLGETFPMSSVSLFAYPYKDLSPISEHAYDEQSIIPNLGVSCNLVDEHRDDGRFKHFNDNNGMTLNTEVFETCEWIDLKSTPRFTLEQILQQSDLSDHDILFDAAAVLCKQTDLVTPPAVKDIIAKVKQIRSMDSVEKLAQAKTYHQTLSQLKILWNQSDIVSSYQFYYCITGILVNGEKVANVYSLHGDCTAPKPQSYSENVSLAVIGKRAGLDSALNEYVALIIDKKTSRKVGVAVIRLPDIDLMQRRDITIL
jgi:hypothetical protein